MEKAVVLIIHNDPNMRKTLGGMLNIRGYSVLTAKDGAEGLALLQKKAVDLALIDLGLPEISVLEVFSRIKAGYASTAVIILTDNATLESAIEANWGAFSYLLKPCDIDQMMLQIKLAIEKQQADAALRKSDAKFCGLLGSAADGKLIVNDRQEILMANRQFERMSGYTRSQVVDRDMGMLVSPRFIHHHEYSSEYIRNPKMECLGQGGDFYALREGGLEFPVENSLSALETREGTLLTAAVRDITEHKNYQTLLEHQASHDGLTGLPNRYLLQDRLSQALLSAERHQQKVAVLFVDLDHFKIINDSLGHNIGDHLLEIVAKRLTCCIQSSDTVARQGGDDFVIVLTDVMEDEDAARVAHKIHSAINQVVNIDGHNFEICCSIGISIYPKDGKDVHTLLKNADAALSCVKNLGRGTGRCILTLPKKKRMLNGVLNTYVDARSIEPPSSPANFYERRHMLSQH